VTLVTNEIFGEIATTGTSFQWICWTYTPFPCPFSVLAIVLFIYYISVPVATETRTEVK